MELRSSLRPLSLIPQPRLAACQMSVSPLTLMETISPLTSQIQLHVWGPSRYLLTCVFSHFKMVSQQKTVSDPRRKHTTCSHCCTRQNSGLNPASVHSWDQELRQWLQEHFIPLHFQLLLEPSLDTISHYHKKSVRSHIIFGALRSHRLSDCNPHTPADAMVKWGIGPKDKPNSLLGELPECFLQTHLCHSLVKQLFLLSKAIFSIINSLIWNLLCGPGCP